MLTFSGPYLLCVAYLNPRTLAPCTAAWKPYPEPCTRWRAHLNPKAPSLPYVSIHHATCHACHHATCRACHHAFMPHATCHACRHATCHACHHAIMPHAMHAVMPRAIHVIMPSCHMPCMPSCRHATCHACHHAFMPHAMRAIMPCAVHAVMRQDPPAGWHRNSGYPGGKKCCRPLRSEAPPPPPSPALPACRPVPPSALSCPAAPAAPPMLTPACSAELVELRVEREKLLSLLDQSGTELSQVGGGGGGGHTQSGTGPSQVGGCVRGERHMLSLSHTLSHSHTHALAHTCSHACSHAHMHTHAHAQHIESLAPSCPPPLSALSPCPVLSVS